MALCRSALVLALMAVVTAMEVRPVEKVIDLITGLKNEVEAEGAEEATSYDKFACFCKDETMKRSRSVRHLHETIDLKSADIADQTQQKKDASVELADRKANQEKLSMDLDQHNVQCAKDRSTYDAESADLTKAISGLRKAIKAMQQTGGSAAAALLEVKRSVLSASSVLRSSAVAQERLTALSKVDPEDAEYDYHSNDIVELCKSLLTDFKGQNDELNTEWGKTDKACTGTRASLKKEMASNSRSMNQLDRKIESLAKKIAEAREDLVEADADLKDDELYLKDLTARCEERANDFDQRSQMRNDELQALKTALGIISKDVKGRDEQVNQRAMFVQTGDIAVKVVAPSSVEKVSSDTKTVAKSLSFLQQRESSTNALALEAKKRRAITFLQGEGRRLGSMAISALASRSVADPFKKVKGLIQKLTERLLAESAAEATKKGFCDESIASAEHERNSRFQQAKDLNREIAGLEAKEDELTEEISTLTKDITEETASLKEATQDRNTEKADNTKAISVAQEGSEAVGAALLTLRSFYSNAAKAAAFIQASPVDEDSPGAASGSYNGKQGGMKAVFSLLEVIQSDFDRTIRKTEESESRAHRAFVEFSQTSKSSIAGKETKKELDEQDLKSTKTSIKRKMSDLEETTDLMDQALKELEELKPTCIDTGMSYKERVAKREEEMRALEKALCILDTEKVEKMCV